MGKLNVPSPVQVLYTVSGTNAHPSTSHNVWRFGRDQGGGHGVTQCDIMGETIIMKFDTLLWLICFANCLTSLWLNLKCWYDMICRIRDLVHSLHSTVWTNVHLRGTTWYIPRGPCNMPGLNLAIARRCPLYYRWSLEIDRDLKIFNMRKNTFPVTLHSHKNIQLSVLSHTFTY